MIIMKQILEKVFPRKSQNSDYVIIFKVFMVISFIAIINPNIWIVISFVVIYLFLTTE